MTIEISGKWYNQHGSVLALGVGEDGEVSGTFESHVGLDQPDGIHPVKGFVCGDLVEFVVPFPRHGSLSCWVGHVRHEQSGDRIDTLWNMAVQMPEGMKQDESWRGTWSGADLFLREPHQADVAGRPRATWPERGASAPRRV
jgi:hypothetical protein